jgi:hypothetical protein
LALYRRKTTLDDIEESLIQAWAEVQLSSGIILWTCLAILTFAFIAPILGICLDNLAANDFHKKIVLNRFELKYFKLLEIMNGITVD